ncbi:hypothetical protein [Pedobacter caeni]|uniref:Outer membrane protein beta-barrel domain-containing protein n=1 Tax=Pedobacter caeni TaxID=288992 RepID=A0A1M5I074_9SPHI|nr:hypothetical protein [Pedobacter caeni]SHG21671.1 hypothetical protein SAMN04488522_104905 [Pedobacter caeni]
MRKLTLVFSLLLAVLSVQTLFAQQSTTPAPVAARAQNIFIELGGQGLTFTANYDSRFSNKRDGLGGRAGIGYFSVDGDKVMTLPLSLNYLLGKGNKFFELGLGATYISTSGSSEVLFNKNESNVIGTMSFFYRVQPEDSGFAFRIGLSPVFSKDFFLPYYGGLSLGYTF